ncbi:4Fe-4S cluster-binding domain-containing protein [Streptomyces sp. NPDC058195]|uniref:4Fe-4S cluster-binding domain-containing protein n=1 Tax=Streptomyces sp. NPDC058195 TaxID=3346375 RepID=UPI0036E99BB7
MQPPLARGASLVRRTRSVGRDLTRLAKSYRSANVKILGGEPLLHPGLTDLIREVRESAVTDKIILATNGLLLSSADDRL